MADVSVCDYDRIHLQFAPVVLLRLKWRCESKKSKGKSTANLRKWFFSNNLCLCFSSFLPPQGSSYWWDNNPWSASANYPKSVIIIIFHYNIFKKMGRWGKQILKPKNIFKEVNCFSRAVSVWTILIHVDIRTTLLSRETLILCDYIFSISFLHEAYFL